jgi:glucosamine--fructose-6-phosphate aminotransferase (isomerizing)
MATFEEELYGQPEALEKTLDYYINQSGILQDARERFHVNGINNITFTGMGSSLFTCIVAQNYISKHGYIVDIQDTSELLLRMPQNYPPTSLLVLVSQSGESGEIVKLLEKLRQTHNVPPIWAITNSLESTLAQNADLVFPTLAGEETSVTSKTYVSTLLVQFLLASSLVAPIFDLRALQALANPVVEHVGALLGAGRDAISGMMDHLGAEFGHLYFIGRGCSMATACQATLNLQELCRVPAQVLSAGQFRHGPIEVVDENFRAILLNAARETGSFMEDLASSISQKWGGGKSVVVSNSGSLDGQDSNIYHVAQPITNEYLAPIGEIIPIQLFMVEQAKVRGIETPGEFRNTQKITKDE